MKKNTYKILLFVFAAAIFALSSVLIPKFDIFSSVEEYQSSQVIYDSEVEKLNAELNESNASSKNSEQSDLKIYNEDKPVVADGENSKSQSKSISASESKSEEINAPKINNSLPHETVKSTAGQQLQCTLSVTCTTILNNWERLNPEKVDIVPKDGIIYPEQAVTFYEGESVFYVLLREMKKERIHLEFSNAAIYSSAYIEGISNIYEFDCGELSGWMYKVNGQFPNYGCSKYILKEGDNVEWIYTCDLGKDIGGSYSAQQE